MYGYTKCANIKYINIKMYEYKFTNITCTNMTMYVYKNVRIKMYKYNNVCI